MELDSDFWQHYAVQFDQLPTAPIRLNWKFSKGDIDRYVLSAASPFENPTDELMGAFATLSQRCGERVDPLAPEPFHRWLRELISRNYRKRPETERQPNPGEGSMPDLRRLSVITCRALESEALQREHKGKLGNAASTPNRVNATLAPKLSLADQLDAIRRELELSYEEVAEGIEIDPTNVSRHMTDRAKPSRLTRQKYEKYLSNLLNEDVVITKTQLKRSPRAVK